MNGASTANIVFRREVPVGLGLSDADVEQIVSLVKRGIHVSRSTMSGGEYVSVNWSFSQDDDDEADEPVTDDRMAHLLNGVSQ